MTTPLCWRPTTGADSVAFPADARLDGPAGEAAFKRYIIDCEDAAMRETADEAIVRCRAEAELLDDGGARFDGVLDCLTTTFDCHVRDLNSPDKATADIARGMGFNEVTYYGDWQIDRLRHANVEMNAAYDTLDRERFRKAAAVFAEVVADWGITWKPIATTAPSDAATRGG